MNLPRGNALLAGLQQGIGRVREYVERVIFDNEVQVGSATIINQGDANKMGIGTLLPYNKLHVSGDSVYFDRENDGNIQPICYVANTGASVGTGAAISLRNNAASDVVVDGVMLKSEATNVSFGNWETDFIIDNRVAGSNQTVMRFVGGNCAVGDQTPDSRLDVKGGLTLRELSSDPGSPDEGASVLWMSDGTGTGDDGDIMVKITAGGITKTGTLVDFSSL